MAEIHFGVDELIDAGLDAVFTLFGELVFPPLPLPHCQTNMATIKLSICPQFKPPEEVCEDPAVDENCTFWYRDTILGRPSTDGIPFPLGLKLPMKMDDDWYGVEVTLPALLDRCNFGPVVQQGKYKLSQEDKVKTQLKIDDFIATEVDFCDPSVGGVTMEHPRMAQLATDTGIVAEDLPYFLRNCKYGGAKKERGRGKGTGKGPAR